MSGRRIFAADLIEHFYEYSSVFRFELFFRIFWSCFLPSTFLDSIDSSHRFLVATSCRDAEPWDAAKPGKCSGRELRFAEMQHSDIPSYSPDI